MAKPHVHLADVVVLDVGELQIDKDETAEDAVVKDEIDPVVGVIERDAVLPADEGKVFPQLQEERLKVIAEAGFQIGLGDGVRLGDFQKLEDVRIAQQVAGLGDDLALGSKLEDGVLVLSGSEAEEERGFLLALKLGHGPFVSDGLLLIEAAFERMFELQEFYYHRPAQLVRRCRTFVLLRQACCRLEKLDFFEVEIGKAQPVSLVGKVC